LTHNDVMKAPSEVVLRVAILTGGSRGIGRSSVMKLAASGVNVVFTYNTNADAAKEVAAEAGGYGPRVSALQLDVTKVDTFDSFVDQVRAELADSARTDSTTWSTTPGSGIPLLSRTRPWRTSTCCTRSTCGGCSSSRKSSCR
jgi:short chain dehydrogenase